MEIPTNKELKTLVCVLCCNEAGKIEKVIERLSEMKKSNPEYSIRIINDGSDDGSEEIINSSPISQIIHEYRQGVGATVRTGVDYACENDYDVIVIMAGNDKDRPLEIPNLISKINEGYDFVIGSRHMEGGKYDNTPLYRVLATRYIHPWVVWLTTGRKLTDTSTGFRAMRTSFFKDPKINLHQDWLNSYDGEMYAMYQAIALGYKITEVPASKIYPLGVMSYSKMKPITGWWKMLRGFFWLRLGWKK